MSDLHLTIGYPSSDTAQEIWALLIQQELSQIEISLELYPMEPSAYSNTLYETEKPFDLFFNGYIMGSGPQTYATLFLTANADRSQNYARISSSAIDTQFAEDYVTVQMAFGASRTEIMFRHVLKNVLLPVITKLGMAMPMLITGAIITETVFSWPGIGPYFTAAVGGLDYPVVMVILLLSSTMVILGNLLSDILCCLTDPRIKTMG